MTLNGVMAVILCYFTERPLPSENLGYAHAAITNGHSDSPPMTEVARRRACVGRRQRQAARRDDDTSSESSDDSRNTATDDCDSSEYRGQHGLTADRHPPSHSGSNHSTAATQPQRSTQFTNEDHQNCSVEYCTSQSSTNGSMS